MVDDDADDRALFCEALQEAAPQFICHAATNGRTALTKLNNRENDLPDLIFLDVNMPVMNGWQCLAALKNTEDYKHIPVIIYSTSSHPEDIEKAQQAGALCFFTKPANFKDLRRNLELVVVHLTGNTLASLATASPCFV